MTVVRAGGADIPEIPDGLYQATIKAVVPVTLEQPDHFGKTEKFKITLAFTDSDGVAQTLDPQVNQAWGERATLFTIANAAGCECDPDMDFDTDDLLNRKVNILVEQEVETKPDGSTKLKWPRVKSWARVKGGRAAAPTPPPPPSASRKPGPVLNPDNTVDWDAFYRETERLGATKEGIFKTWGGEAELLNAEPVAVANWLYEWADRVS